MTSVAVRKLDSGQTVSFSIHQVAERRQIRFDQIEQHYDDLERETLTAFFGHLGNHRGMKYVHWNMRDVNYGFQAIEHRFRVWAANLTSSRMTRNSISRDSQSTFTASVISTTLAWRSF